VLETLLCDEVRHAATGRALLSLLTESFAQLPVRGMLSRLPGMIEDERVRLRALYRAAATGAPGRALGVSLRPEDLDTASE
jgi:hypothetical protein